MNPLIVIGELILRSIVFLLGLYLSAVVFHAAVRTFVLPRSAPDFVTGILFSALRKLFEWRLHWVESYDDRDRIMAFFAPYSLILLWPYWLTLQIFGFGAMLWATGVGSFWFALTVSGSSLLTLGFASGDRTIHIILEFAAGTVGLMLVALLIAYLPLMYTAFSRRENAVTRLAVRAGDPPSAVEMLLRFQRLGRLDRMTSIWLEWEVWFSEIEESHTSLAALVFFRSPQPEHSWVTAAGAVLDAASLRSAALDMPRDFQSELCIRAGFLALRRIADYFGVEYTLGPSFPEVPISINREEFEDVLDELERGGLPVRSDREAAWRDFGGWRVNYDEVLLRLSTLTMAPYAPWSSDRSLRPIE